MTETKHLLQAAFAHHRNGNVTDAERLYRQVLAYEPNNVDALHLLGLIAHHAGHHAAAVELIGKAIAHHPSAADFHNNLGEAYRGLGNLSAAVACYARATDINPRLAEAHHNLGVAKAEEGNVAEAEAHYRQAIAANPQFARSYNNLGNLLSGQGRSTEAIVALEQALGASPGFAEAHNNLGSVLKELGRLDEARAHYQKALEAKPDFAPALSNLGSLCFEHGQMDDAINFFRRALGASAPPAGIWINLGKALSEQGRWREAEDAYGRAGEAQPGVGADIALACAVPVIPESAGELAEARARSRERIAALERRELAIGDPLTEVNAINFYLAYQGEDNREPHEQLGRMYARACSSLSFAAAHCTGKRALTKGKIRLGFVSRLIGQQSVARALMSGVLQKLSRERFSVQVFSFPHWRNAEYATMAAAADEVTLLAPVLDTARAAIAAAELDVLCYIDIGMDPITYFLAFSRLARVQCATWMHPVTTGIPAIDYFLSSELFEPPDGAAHYSERLVQLKNLPTYYTPPEHPRQLRSKAELGFPEGAPMYFCPQSLYKIHPEFDGVLADILRADPSGTVYLIEGNHRNWTEILRRRLQASLGTASERIRFLPRIQTKDFPHFLAAADVILDPLHWSGGITSLEALSLGTPIVTLPGKLMRGRVTHGIYRQMGLSDCVAMNAKDYASLAVRLALDRGFNESVRKKILAKNAVLYENAKGVRDYERFFESVLKA